MSGLFCSLAPRAVPFALAVAVCLPACGSDSTSPNPLPRSGLAADVELDAGTYELVMQAADLTMVLSRQGDPLLRFPAGGVQLGAVDAIDDAFNYDPYPLLVPGPLTREPDGLRWLSVNRAELVSSDATAFDLRLTFQEGKQALLHAEASASGRFRLVIAPQEPGVPVALIRLRPLADAREGFYGLGEYFDDVNHRGHVRAMQLEADGTIESGYNEAHVPVPLIIGTRGWGLFVESRYPGAFDVASRADDQLDIAFGTGAASVEGLAFHLLAAEQPIDITRLYYDITGYPKLPSRWALGPWVWRDENRDQAQVENDLQTMRDLDLATSAVWIDRPYATGVNTFDFNPAQFPDPRAMIEKAHALGFRMGLWHTPYLDESDASTRPLREEAEQKGYYPKKSGMLLNKWGRPVDLTNSDAYEWWQGLIRRYTEMGIEGFKMDYGEDVVPGLLGARNIWEFADGSDERTMHSLYTLLYHRVYAETLPADGGFLLCRAGKYGDQASARVIWPGDLDASFSKHRDKLTVEGKTFNAVGGLPASMIAGLTLGPSGFPFYGSDTGGYRHSPPDKELFVRWFEQTALSSVMQIGTSSNDVAWEPTADNGFDAEMLEWYREYTRLHLRLFPYEWTYAQRIALDGRPIQRPMGLAFPDLAEHPWDQYMFGDDLLVAPVVERGQRVRSVLLPGGTWVDWWTGAQHQGGKRVDIDAPLDRLPLLVRAGGIIPLLRPTIDTLSPTTEPSRVDSYATTPGILYARVVPGPESSFSLFDGAELAQKHDGSSVTLVSGDGNEFKLGVVFELLTIAEKPSSVTDHGVELTEVASESALEQQASGWVWDAAAGGRVIVKVGAGAHTVVVKR